MSPILNIGPLTLPAYTILLDAGIITGLLAAFWESRRRGYDLDTFLDAASWVIGAGIVGARAYYVAINWGYFATHLGEALRFWEGGLAFRGAFLGGLMALAFFSLSRQTSLLPLLDAAALGLAPAQAIGWVGALLQGIGYGYVSHGFLSQELPDIYGLIAPRFPTQALSSVSFVLIFVVLLASRWRQSRPGLLFVAYLLLSSLCQLLLGFTRADETVYIGLLRFDQIVDATGLVAAVSWLLYWKSGIREQET